MLPSFVSEDRNGFSAATHFLRRDGDALSVSVPFFFLHVCGSIFSSYPIGRGRENTRHKTPTKRRFQVGYGVAWLHYYHHPRPRAATYSMHSLALRDVQFGPGWVDRARRTDWSPFV